MTELYGIEQIENHDFREGCRLRPNMYLGSNDINGIFQALKEIINNSTDEALAGFGDKIEVSLNEEKNEITVRDYGRGVPFGLKEGKQVLVSIFTDSHTGGKFGKTAYKNSAGLNGCGGACVNNTSVEFQVISYRDGKAAEAIFAKGILTSYKEYDTKEKNGTFVRFIPDAEVFTSGDTKIDFARVCEEIKNISYLNSNLKFYVTNGTQNEIYYAKNGIKDYIRDNIDNPLHKTIIYNKVTDGTDEVEIALQWGAKHETFAVFANGTYCCDGGAPVTGMRTSITKTINSLAGTSLSGEAIRNNVYYVINCKVEEPSFADQTKRKINNESLRKLASLACTNALKEFASKNNDDFKSVISFLTKVEKAEAAAERARQTVLNTAKDVEKAGKKKVFNVDKLSDARTLGNDAILLLVEGKSAGGAMQRVRDVDKYGILKLRGKVINALANSEEDVLKNEEVQLFLKATGINISDYRKSKLRYGRVAICVDADDDGMHIACLIITLIYKLAPQFIEENRLCWLHAPLFKIVNGKETHFYYTESDLSNAKKGTQTRFKGLGEMKDEDAAAMFGSEQWLEVLKWDAEVSSTVEALMGEDSQPRKEFIFNNINFEDYGEV